MYNVYRYPMRSEYVYKHVSLKRTYATLYEERTEANVNDKKLDNSLSRTRRLFFDYALCNRFDLFFTSTFDKEKIDRYSFEDVTKGVCTWFKNFRNRYDKYFRYMFIPEQHSDGAFHLHGLMTLSVGMCSPLMIPKRNERKELIYVPNSPHYLAWPSFSSKFGYFSASHIKDYEKAVSYVTGYITKSFTDPQFKGRRLLFKSKNLNKPEKVVSSYMSKTLYDADFENEFCQVSWRNEDDTAPVYEDWIRIASRMEAIDVPGDFFLPILDQVSIYEMMGERR